MGYSNVKGFCIYEPDSSRFAFSVSKVLFYQQNCYIWGVVFFLIGAFVAQTQLKLYNLQMNVKPCLRGHTVGTLC